MSEEPETIQWKYDPYMRGFRCPHGALIHCQHCGEVLDIVEETHAWAMPGNFRTQLRPAIYESVLANGEMTLAERLRFLSILETEQS